MNFSSIPHTSTKSISITHTKNNQFRCSHKNQVISGPHTKPNLFRPPEQKPSPHSKPVMFGPHTENTSILTPAQKQANFDAPRHKHLVDLGPAFKLGHFRPPHTTESTPIPTLKSVLFLSPHCNQAYFDHPHNQVNLDVNTKSM